MYGVQHATIIFLSVISSPLLSFLENVYNVSRGMKTYIAAFVIASLAALIVVPLVKRMAEHFGACRSETGVSIPRWGGIGVYVSFLLPLVALFFYDNDVSKLFFREAKLLEALFLGGTLVLLLGAWDDWKGLRALTKLGFEILIASFVYWNGFRISEISLPFNGVISLGWVSLPVTVLWVVGMMNAINLIDGIDGLATGVAFFSAMALGVVSAFADKGLNILISCALGGALLGFLRYNFNPAKIYLGDSGSLFLGYLLSIIAIWGSEKSTAVVALLTPMVAFGLPILDMAVSILRRYFRGLPIFARDREHIHHKLSDMGLSHRKVVLVLYAFCILLNGVALALYFSRRYSLILGVLAVGVLLGLKYLGYLHGRVFKDRWDEYDKIRKERFYRHVLRQLVGELNGQPIHDKLWFLVKSFSERANFDFAKLEVLGSNGNGESPKFVWSRDGNGSQGGHEISGAQMIIFPIVNDSKIWGTLELRKAHEEDSTVFFSGTEILAKEISKLFK